MRSTTFLLAALIACTGCVRQLQPLVEHAAPPTGGIVRASVVAAAAAAPALPTPSPRGVPPPPVAPAPPPAIEPAPRRVGERTSGAPAATARAPGPPPGHAACSRVVVTDFGLVTPEFMLGAATPGALAGSAAYMAPEVISGKFAPGRDLWSTCTPSEPWLSSS